MTVLPFPSFLDDVKEKGFKRAVFEGVNEVVERATPGMNIQDLREALRGEPASRKPNPRLTPHADGFWLHMRPSYFNRDVTGLYPSFRLGWLSTYFVFFETITGIFLMIWYTPSPDAAYGNMINILTMVPLGQFMRDLHRLGAEAMVLIVTLHMLRTFFTASYKKPRQFTWFTGVVLLLATLFLSFSGYLLPWDQLALWAVTIGASMAEAAPPEIVGTNVNLLLRGGPDIGANGLLRFYLLHVLAVPAILFIFTGVHYYKVVLHGHSLPPKGETVGEDTAKRVPLDKRVYFTPDILTSEIMWIAITTFILVVLVTWFYHAPLENHADNQVTPLGTTAPWYFLWLQGGLKLGDKVIWGIVFPTIVFVFLMAMPYLDMGRSRRFAHRRFMLTVALLMMSGTVILSYMGLPEFGVKVTADHEILHELVMPPQHNHLGKLLPIPYDEIVVGMYTTREIEAGPENAASAVNALNQEIAVNGQADAIKAKMQTVNAGLTSLNFTTVPADAPELHDVLAWFDKQLGNYPGELQGGVWGGLIVTQDQTNTKRIDAFIIWPQDNGESQKQQAAIVPIAQVAATAQATAEATAEPADKAAYWRVESDLVFINENSQYFEAPGA